MIFAWPDNKSYALMWCFTLLTCLFPAYVFALSVSSVDDIDLGIWDGSAVFSANDDICVFETKNICDNGTCTYSVRARDSAFEVSNGVDPGVPFRVFYNDQSGVSGNQELMPGSSLLGQTGIFPRNCSGVNGNFQIVFESANLNSLNPGIYTGVFKYSFIRDGAPGKRAQGNLNVNITIPDIVQISGMNDIPLTLSGLFYQGGDNFCVYRNGAGGTYSVTASSANSVGPGVFTLVSAGGSANYDVFFDDAVGATSASTALTESTSSGGFVGTNVYSPVCTAASASVYIESAVTNFTLGGSYGDTLTITIMPE